jgi:hypothetical protein
VVFEGNFEETRMCADAGLLPGENEYAWHDQNVNTR